MSQYLDPGLDQSHYPTMDISQVKKGVDIDCSDEKFNELLEIAKAATS